MRIAHERGGLYTMACSLEWSAYIFIAKNIQCYSVMYISSLPARLRSVLLSLLPAYKICELEKTSVVDGVCLEDVWEKVWQRCKTSLLHYMPFKDPHVESLMDAGKEGWLMSTAGQKWGRRSMHWEGETLSAVEVPVTGRDAFFMSLTNCVLSCWNYDGKSHDHALKAIFCAPELHNEPLHQDAYSTFELLCFIVKCQFCPRLLELCCTSIIHIGIWDRKEESFSLLTALSSEVTHLAIYEGEHNTYVQREVLSEVCRYLLEAVFSNPRPSVTHFKLTCSRPVFSLRALGHVADIIGSKSSQCGQFTREVHTQYSGLRLLAVCIESSIWELSLPTLCKQNVDIQSIIENQKNLHTLHIRTRPTRIGSVATPEYDQLIRCVGNLFSKPTFHRLGLYDFSFIHSSGQHVWCFNEIMLNFLCSPVRGQELEMKMDMKFLPSDLTLDDLHMHQCQQPPDTVKNSKSLLIKPTPVNDVSVAFFSAFFSSSFYPLWTLGYLHLDYLSLPADTLATISELEWPAS